MRGPYGCGEEVGVCKEQQQEEYDEVHWQHTPYLTSKFVAKVARDGRVWRHVGVDTKIGRELGTTAHAEGMRS